MSPIVTSTTRTDFASAKATIHRKLIQKLNLDKLTEANREDVRREVSQILEGIVHGEAAPMNLQERERLVQEVLDAGKRSGEPGWPLPMWDDYKELIKSDVADIKNSGGRPAGTITAAMFLREFAEGYPWVHLDIAGTAYTESDLGTVPRGPTGVPVGTFVEFVRGRAR